MYLFAVFILLRIAVTSNQIERLWSRFTSLDKQQKGYLTREDFLRIPELAINPLGDRIVHAFFRYIVYCSRSAPEFSAYFFVVSSEEAGGVHRYYNNRLDIVPTRAGVG